jgi:glycosyltransferase involved in cell wall biosynthesis
MAVSVLGRDHHRAPVVSVIIPVFNTKAYLRQCLDSVAAQTLQEIEVICVDNGSTDGSYEFLQAYAQCHANVTVVRHAEGRQGGARNAGISRAKGEYIGFVDSDDFVSPNMLQGMVDAAHAGRADVAVCNIELYFGGNRHGGQVLPDDLLSGDEPFSIQQRARLLRNLTICNKLFSRELIERRNIRFPEDSFHEDQFFVTAAFISAHRIITIPELLYFYRRQRPGSVNEYRGRDSMHVFRVMQRVSDYIENRGMNESLGFLINEVKVLKYLQIYRLTGKRFQREYFSRMKKEFQAIELEADVQILSPSERREFEIVLRYGYVQHNLFLLLRSIYGRLRQCATKLAR